ncbi:MAG: hypothetical protein HW421_1657 [Ignavibacteria bacterium]|nr:hypothetical protein [Ignavibacteria bacterium]
MIDKIICYSDSQINNYIITPLISFLRRDLGVCYFLSCKSSFYFFFILIIQLTNPEKTFCYISDNPNVKTGGIILYDELADDYKVSVDSAKQLNSIADEHLIPPEKYRIADNRRWTLTGSQPNEQTKIKPVPTILLASLFTGIFIVQHEMQQNTIWKDVGPFNVREDGKYTAYIDKPGHIYGTYMPSYLLSEFLITSGFNPDDATLLGGALGLAYNSYIEVLDGFSIKFGFSPTDWFANIFGAGFFVAQHYFPVLQNFTPKFMYVNPPWLGEYNRKQAETFIDNYSAQNFYLSVNVHNLLPEYYKNYWPSWLELSIGYAVYGLSVGTTDNGAELIYHDPHFTKVYGNRKLLISLDYNLINLLPEGPGFWNWMRQSLNYFKLPSPTLEIGRITKFYLLYPFPMQIGNFRF